LTFWNRFFAINTSLFELGKNKKPELKKRMEKVLNGLNRIKMNHIGNAFVIYVDFEG